MKTAAVPLFLIAIALTASSCDDKGSPETNCYLLKQTSAGGGVIRNNYIGNVLTSQITDNDSVAFEYDNEGRLVKLSRSADSYNVLSYQDNAIVKQEWFSNSELIDRETYGYDGSNRLTRIQKYNVVDGADERTFYKVLIYTNSNNNISRIEWVRNTESEPYATEDYTYSSERSAISATPPEVTKYFRLDGSPIQNNLLRSVDNNGQTVDYTYSFNSHGYPTKETRVYSSGVTIALTNAYSCN